MSPAVTETAQQSVADLARINLARTRVFERWGIDYCCHGRQTLAEACAKIGADVNEVTEQLEACDRRSDEETALGDESQSLADLSRHIVDRHHTFLRRELPRLKQLLIKVVAAHGEKHPELCEIGQVYDALDAELSAHMLKEERVLFPIIAALEEASARRQLAPSFHCGSVNNPISVMEDEHQHAGDALARIRTLTRGYVPPPDACTTYQALLSGLAELEADLHVHIHKENNILFPRAAELEARLHG